MIWGLLLISSLTWADPSGKWSNAVDIVDKHEFYQSNEVIKKPKNSWQTLFGVIYNDANLKRFKDCLFYRVPGEEDGILKLKTVNPEEKCESHLFSPGDKEWKELKALQYSITDNRLSLHITHPKFRVEEWEVILFNVFTSPRPKNLMSSAEYRSLKMIFLNPYHGQKMLDLKKGERIADKTLCHDIGEDCREISPSTCSSCPEGWYEIPNGCREGPKYCGRIECGRKNQPACRRGMKYQRQKKSYSCRDDNSFAFCHEGLRIQCTGNLPYCI